MEPHPRRRVAQRGGRSGWAQKAHLQGGLGSEKWGLRVGTGVGGQARISPSWGEEGSVVAELSLRAELLCSSGRLRTELSGTPLPSRCRFLFFTRMRPIRSWGLGRGTPGASWWAWLSCTDHLAGHTLITCLVDEQSVPKDGAAVLSHLGLLFRPVGPRSEVRGSWGEAEIPRVDQRLAR